MLNTFLENSILNKDEIIFLINSFDTSGKLLYGGNRNAIKIFEINNGIINIKSFKVPNLINKIIYKYFRKSKIMLVN